MSSLWCQIDSELVRLQVIDVTVQIKEFSVYDWMHRYVISLGEK